MVERVKQSWIRLDSKIPFLLAHCCFTTPPHPGAQRALPQTRRPLQRTYLPYYYLLQHDIIVHTRLYFFRGNYISWLRRSLHTKQARHRKHSDNVKDTGQWDCHGILFILLSLQYKDCQFEYKIGKFLQKLTVKCDIFNFKHRNKY